MKRVTMILLTALLIIFVAGCEDSTLLREARTLRDAENWEDAIEKYKEFLEKNPETRNKEDVKKEISQCYYDWGRLSFKIKRYDAGIHAMEQIIKHYRQTEHYADAMRQLPVLYLENGRKLFSNGDIAGAGENYRTVLSRFRTSVQAQEAWQELEELGVITFSSNGDLYAVNADGSNLKKVTENGFDADISAVGQKIAFIRPTKKGAERGKLMVINLDGTGENELLTYPSAFHPVFSQDGDLIAVSKGSNYQIIRPDGSGKETHYNVSGFDRLGAWSPDSTKLVAYQKGKTSGPYKVWVLESNFETYYALTSKKNEPVLEADWSSDGRKILYITHKGLYLISPSGNTELIHFLDAEAQNLDIRAMDISPTGKHIVMIAKGGEEENFGFYTVNLQKEVMKLELITEEPVKIDPGRASWGRGFIPSEGMRIYNR